MPILDLSQISIVSRSSYPGQLAEAVSGRSWQALGDVGGITQFGVNLVFIEPGSASSLRHYHLEQDEFAMMTEGELVLVENEGEIVMRPGDCAAWPAGQENGHHLVNRSDKRAAFLVVGTRTLTETAIYSDIDMMVTDTPGAENNFTRKNGSPLTADQIGDRK
ncbi:cupin domain-containing protein [Sedimentitalea todarodis]|uniref:Cupin domain-containing protein n=1 Tax=Sedimentitalea todarodis TaxID=1631240 RepID=A0ABU3VCT2_9RHOB|nr:cupin domain-containing protein [Sedimentitalea todarodis]MDU9003981.1 cupin domain-containing protein [Sedimentitalea todarodis]